MTQAKPARGNATRARSTMDGGLIYALKSEGRVPIIDLNFLAKWRMSE